jgi:REP element-mobilizing transposase RayT
MVMPLAAEISCATDMRRAPTDEDILRNQRFDFEIGKIEYSNNFNHLHMLLRFPSRAIYLRFIRSLTGSLALAVTKASKMKSLKSIFGEDGFWDFRPFTRVVRSWRGYRIAMDYVLLNDLESMSVLPKRSERLRGIASDERRYFRRGLSLA